MFVKIDAEEALKHIGSFAHIQTVDGEHLFRGKLFIHPDHGIAIKFGKGDDESEPSFVELHPLVIGEQQILMWAAPGEPDFSLLEPVKQSDPITASIPEAVSDVSTVPTVENTDDGSNTNTVEGITDAEVVGEETDSNENIDASEDTKVETEEVPF